MSPVVHHVEFPHVTHSCSLKQLLSKHVKNISLKEQQILAC